MLAVEVERLKDATDNLINQQFYKNGQDLIIGRTPDVSVKIKNSGQIIKKFKEIFNQNLSFFFKGDYFNFLLPFRKIKGITEENIKEIHEELLNKLEALKGADFDTVVLYTIVLSSIISRIREFHFNMAIDEIKKRVTQKAKNLTHDDIQGRLDELFMRNNHNVSILYNLSYIDALADSFNYKSVARICKIQKGKYINRIVSLVSNP